MARIGGRRPPAQPATGAQLERRGAILAAAARLGRERALDQIGAQEIAAEAGVALRTLYRYYPSKYHVFAAVLDAQLERMASPVATTGDPGRAVGDLMADSCRKMLQNRHLAHAMITSTQMVRADSGGGTDIVRGLILVTAGVERPNPGQLRIARLVEQVCFGILTWTVGGELTLDEAMADIRAACRLLIGASFDEL